MNNSDNKLLFFIEEEHRNLHHLIRAMHELSQYFPLNEHFFNELTNDKIDLLDRFIFRFTKTVDAMGKRLFPEILNVLGEREDNMFFRDILNRLEKMGILNNVEDWNTYRERRNSLTHEYPNTNADKIAMLADAYEMSFELVKIFDKIKKILDEKTTLSMATYPSPDLNLLSPFTR